MGKPSSLDLRESIVAYGEAGHSARVLGVSASTAVRLPAASRRHGRLAPKRHGRAQGTAGKLAPHRAFLLGVAAAEPGITLQELGGALLQAEGVRVPLSSLHRALRRARWSFEKDWSPASATGLTQSGTAPSGSGAASPGGAAASTGWGSSTRPRSGMA